MSLTNRSILDWMNNEVEPSLYLILSMLQSLIKLVLYLFLISNASLCFQLISRPFHTFLSYRNYIQRKMSKQLFCATLEENAYKKDEFVNNSKNAFIVIQLWRFFQIKLKIINSLKYIYLLQFFNQFENAPYIPSSITSNTFYFVAQFYDVLFPY